MITVKLNQWRESSSPTHDVVDLRRAYST